MKNYAKRRWDRGKYPIPVESFYVLLDEAYADGVADTKCRERKRAARIVKSELAWTNATDRVCRKILGTRRKA